MNVPPAFPYEAVFQSGLPGLVGTVALGLLDNQGAYTDPLDTTGIIETPSGSGIYVANRTSPAVEGQYTLLWSIDGSTDPGSVTAEELVVTFGTPGSVYGSVDELARILKISAPTVAQTAAMSRCLEAASWQADSYMARTTPFTDERQLELVTNAVYDIAREHWQQSEVAFGIWEGAIGAVVIARDTFARHAFKLLSLKQGFGLA
jgi:predicted transcriptional regulator